MGKVFLIPIEPLEERYSAQWLQWFPQAFKGEGVDYEIIHGEQLTSKIETGSFLDVCGTNYYKASQTQKICRMIYEGKIKDKDILFYLDAWNPGLCHVQYMRQGLGLKFKICGILHAGTYDPHDFLSKKGMGTWGRHLENGWLNFIDMVFVATEFHKRLIQEKREPACPIIVTGLPIFPCLPFGYPKERVIVFPHRLDKEKNPWMFDRLADVLKKGEVFKDWSFIKTKDICKTKSEYYALLNKAAIAVSFADQETWGIAQQEALFAGCIPVVPNRLSYAEMYHEDFKYETFTGAVELVEQAVVEFENGSRNLKDLATINAKALCLKGAEAIPKMLNHMGL